MSSSCVTGAIASGGVTVMRAFSSLIPSTCFIACLLFAWIGAKRASMLIHTALRNGNIPPVRGVSGLPGAMSGCGAICTSRGLPGAVGIPGRSEVARWKATITAVIVVYTYIGPKVPVA